MNVDYLIVGQGIAGSLLAYELEKVGLSFCLIDQDKEETSSKKAGGLYNPITGRHMVKTWIADQLFPDLENYYAEAENQLSTQFLYPLPIYRPFFSIEEQNDWQGKASTEEYKNYINEITTTTRGIANIHDPYGGLVLNRSGYVDLPEMLKAFQKYFLGKGSIMLEKFDFDSLIVSESSISYKDIDAQKVIFCEGPDVGNNPYWKDLPFKPVKGELLVIDAPLPKEQIINRGVFMLPRDGKFRVGATYDHSQLDYQPTEKGKTQLMERLAKLYDGPYEITGQSAGIRPATFDRRPLLGWRQKMPSIAIFNGFGTKGVSLVPFFAGHFVNYLNGEVKLMYEVSIDRLK